MPFKDPEEFKAYQQQYRETHRLQECNRVKLWRKAHPEVRKAWDRSIRGHASAAKTRARRRHSYPTTVVLNEKFEGSELHHLTPDIAAYIPARMNHIVNHDVIKGTNMDLVNCMAWGFLAFTEELK